MNFFVTHIVVNMDCESVTSLLLAFLDMSFKYHFRNLTQSTSALATDPPSSTTHSCNVEN